jgi:hypothetical protein
MRAPPHPTYPPTLPGPPPSKDGDAQVVALRPAVELVNHMAQVTQGAGHQCVAGQLLGFNAPVLGCAICIGHSVGRAARA